MTTIVKVSCFPNEGDPQVIAGNPQAGDIVRITTSSGAVIYERYSPPQAPSNPIPRILSKTAFMDVCQVSFGGNGVGRARFGAIIRACAVSPDDEVRFVYERFQGATTFDKDVVSQFLTLLISKDTALITPPVSNAERAAMNSNWPMV